MTSTATDLQEEKLKNPGCFTFIWYIHNFSLHFSRAASDTELCIESPFFAVDSLRGSKWNLGLYPKRHLTSAFLSCYLRKADHSESCAFAFSFRKFNETFETKFEGKHPYLGGSGRSSGEENVISHLELNEPDAYLENDTLTVSCRMWKEGVDSAESGTYCYAHTEVRVSKFDYVWNLRNIVSPNTSEYQFDQSTKITTFISGVPKLEMHVLYKSLGEEDAMPFGIKIKKQEKDVFLVMKIHILNKVGKIIHSVSAEHLFQLANKNQIWNFPIISKKNLCLNEKIYMAYSGLTLKCEFAFSGDPDNCSVSYGSDIPELKCDTKYSSIDGYELWKENLRTFFKDGKLSDAVVRTSSHEFPVHRAILCAQSDIFLAMFESDMKEKKTGIIEIEDLEDETINEMLLYLYTNTIEELDSSAAQKLYYAADRYGIKALLRICSNRLMHHLDSSNVCEILVLADTHQDEELKSSAKDFIRVHVQEVIDSEKWKSLITDNSSLTSEVMQWILCCKFSKVK